MKTGSLTPCLLLLVLSGALLVQMACASNANQGHVSLTELWRDYLDMPEERALAISGDPEKLWVGAAVGGRDSEAEAERGALEECQRRRVLRRMPAPCRLYAVGDTVVWKSW